MTPKDTYRQLCRTETSICIFAQDWWFDTIVGDQNWDVVLAEKNGSIIGAIPYHHKTKLGFSIITVAPFTRYSGLWLKYPAHQKSVSKLSFEQKTITELIDKLPPFSDLTINLASIYTNWKPFYFKGFKQTSYYSYAQQAPVDPDSVWKNMDDGMRGTLRKAENKLTIEASDDILPLLNQSKVTQNDNNTIIKNASKVFQKIFTACQQQQCCKLTHAMYDGEIAASLFMIWDNQCLYTLISGSNPKFNKSGALSLLYWDAVKIASQKQLAFDFTGTMVENVDPYLRDFGLQHTPYSIISKSNNLLFKLKRALKS